MRVGWVFALAIVCACGARSEIAGTFGDDDQSNDGAVTFDGTTHDSSSFDSTATDSGVPCTTPTSAIGFGNLDGASCKFDFEWTCGDTKNSLRGGCDPPGGKNGGLEVVCDINGQPNAPLIDEADASCDCTDANALLAQAEGVCTKQ